MWIEYESTLSIFFGIAKKESCFSGRPMIESYFSGIVNKESVVPEYGKGGGVMMKSFGNTYASYIISKG